MSAFFLHFAKIEFENFEILVFPFSANHSPEFENKNFHKDVN